MEQSIYRNSKLNRLIMACMVVFIMVMALSPLRASASSWVRGSTSYENAESLNETTLGVLDEEEAEAAGELNENDEPSPAEKLFASLFAGIGTGITKALKGDTVDASTTGIIAGSITKGDGEYYFVFDLREGNLYGIIGATVYVALRAMVLLILFIFVSWDIVQTLITGKPEGFAALKQNIYQMIVSLIILYLMPNFVDWLCTARDSISILLFNSISDNSGATSGLSAVIESTYLEAYEANPTFINAIIYLGICCIPLTFLISYTRVAVTQTILFGTFPVFCVLGARDKKLISSWSNVVFTNIFVPTLDLSLILLPQLFIEKIGFSNGVLKAIFVFVLFTSIVPIRNQILQLLGNGFGVEADRSLIGLGKRALSGAKELGGLLRGGNKGQGGSNENESPEMGSAKDSSLRDYMSDKLDKTVESKSESNNDGNGNERAELKDIPPTGDNGLGGDGSGRDSSDELKPDENPKGPEDQSDIPSTGDETSGMPADDGSGGAGIDTPDGDGILSDPYAEQTPDNDPVFSDASSTPDEEFSNNALDNAMRVEPSPNEGPLPEDDSAYGENPSLGAVENPSGESGSAENGDTDNLGSTDTSSLNEGMGTDSTSNPDDNLSGDDYANKLIKESSVNTSDDGKSLVGAGSSDLSSTVSDASAKSDDGLYEKFNMHRAANLQSLDNLKNASNKLDGDTNVLKESNAALKDSNSDLMMRNSKLDKEISSLNSSNMGYSEDSAKAKMANAELNSQVGQIDSENARLSASNSEHTVSMNKAKESLGELNKQRENASNNHQDTSALDSQIADKRAEIKEHQNAIANNKMTIDKNNVAKSELRNQIQNNNATIAKNDARIQNNNRSIANKREMQAQNKASISANNQKISNNQKIIERNNSAKDKMNKEIDRRKGEEKRMAQVQANAGGRKNTYNSAQEFADSLTSDKAKRDATNYKNFRPHVNDGFLTPADIQKFQKQEKRREMLSAVGKAAGAAALGTVGATVGMTATMAGGSDIAIDTAATLGSAGLKVGYGASGVAGKAVGALYGGAKSIVNEMGDTNIVDGTYSQLDNTPEQSPNINTGNKTRDNIRRSRKR